MAGAAKYQVFISSTYEDLKDERDQVIAAVLEMGHIPVGMEMFSAADNEQWQIIARHIEESDYYAVIVAHRVGSLTDGGISYTRKEYEYAVAKGIPALGFVINEKARWPADRIDASDSTTTALKEFKTLVQAKPVSFWSSAEELHARFTVALGKAFVTNPREGWVRTSSANAGAEVTAEVVRLSSENAALRKQLREVNEASGLELQKEIDKTIDTLERTTRTPSYRYVPNGPWQKDSTVSLSKVLKSLGSALLIEATIVDMAKTLAMAIRKDKTQRWHSVAQNQLGRLMADLMTLDLVQPSVRKHAPSDQNEYWSLSSFGHEVFKAFVKLTLATTEDSSAPLESAENDSIEKTDDEDEVDLP